MRVAPVREDRMIKAQSNRMSTSTAPMMPPMTKGSQANWPVCHPNAFSKLMRIYPPAINPATPTANRCRKRARSTPTNPATSATTSTIQSGCPLKNCVANPNPNTKPATPTNNQKSLRPRVSKTIPAKILTMSMGFPPCTSAYCLSVSTHHNGSYSVCSPSSASALQLPQPSQHRFQSGRQQIRLVSRHVVFVLKDDVRHADGT